MHENRRFDVYKPTLASDKNLNLDSFTFEGFHSYLLASPLSIRLLGSISFFILQVCAVQTVPNVVRQKPKGLTTALSQSFPKLTKETVRNASSEACEWKHMSGS